MAAAAPPSTGLVGEEPSGVRTLLPSEEDRYVAMGPGAGASGRAPPG